jgi:hypothetical protein
MYIVQYYFKKESFMSLNKETHTETPKKKLPINGQDASSNSVADPIAAELSRTDLGQMINEYKNVVILIVVAFLVGAVSYVGWKSMKNNQQESARTEVLNFRTNVLLPALEQKKSLADVHSGYTALVGKVQSGSSIMELSSEVVSLVRKDNGATANLDWINAFQSAQKLCDKNDFCYLHFGLIVSNLLEEQQKTEKALDEILSLVGNPYAVEDKLYFDIVRLAQMVNKLETKKQYLDLLKKNHMTSNYKTLAEQI